MSIDDSNSWLQRQHARAELNIEAARLYISAKYFIKSESNGHKLYHTHVGAIAKNDHDDR